MTIGTYNVSIKFIAKHTLETFEAEYLPKLSQYFFKSCQKNYEVTQQMILQPNLINYPFVSFVIFGLKICFIQSLQP